MGRLADSASQDDRLTMSGLTYLRAAAGAAGGSLRFQWVVTPGNLGMAIGGSESPASVFQAVNPVYILLFGIAFSALWTLLGRIDLEPSTPLKFFPGAVAVGTWLRSLLVRRPKRRRTGYGGALLGLSGVPAPNHRELCLSPVGLSMVTRLSRRAW